MTKPPTSTCTRLSTDQTTNQNYQAINISTLSLLANSSFKSGVSLNGSASDRAHLHRIPLGMPHIP